jgi:uncharacterized membrane protein
MHMALNPNKKMKSEVAQLLTESPLRSAVKGFTWRLVATFTTILIVYLITGEQAKALQIGAIEFVTKFVVYYFHERAWLRVSFGQGRVDPEGSRDFG